MSIAERLGQMNAAAEMNVRANAFVQCAAVRLARIPPAELQGKKLLPAAMSALVQKAAVTPGGTTTIASGGALTEISALGQAFLASNRFSCFDQMFESMLRLPSLRSRSVVSTTIGITGFQRGERSAKPLSTLALSGTDTIPQKVAAVVVVSKELAKVMTPDSLRYIGDELRIGVGVETDAAFIATLVSGIAGIPASSATALGVRNHLRGMLQALTLGSNSKVFLITTPTIAGQLAVLSDASGAAAFPDMTPTGGTISGMTVLVSSAVTAGQIIMVDASQIGAVRGDVQLDSAEEAMVVLDTAPDSPPLASTIPTSLWQHDLTALRAERYFTAVRLRTTAVSLLTGAAFFGNSPA